MRHSRPVYWSSPGRSPRSIWSATSCRSAIARRTSLIGTPSRSGVSWRGNPARLSTATLSARSTRWSACWLRAQHPNHTAGAIRRNTRARHLPPPRDAAPHTGQARTHRPTNRLRPARRRRAQTRNRPTSEKRRHPNPARRGRRRRPTASLRHPRSAPTPTAAALPPPPLRGHRRHRRRPPLNVRSRGAPTCGTAACAKREVSAHAQVAIASPAMEASPPGAPSLSQRTSTGCEGPGVGESL
jgi:hypothetical protein